MAERRSESPLRRGPFAAFYWSVAALAMVAVVSGFFGSAEQRMLTGYFVAGTVLVLTVLRFIVQRRQRRDDQARRD